MSERQDQTNIDTVTTNAEAPIVVLGSAVVSSAPVMLGSICMTSGKGTGGAAGATVGSVMILPQPAPKPATNPDEEPQL